jgi:DNA polymerase delta subunit 1
MIRFAMPDEREQSSVRRAMALGKEAAALVSQVGSRMRGLAAPSGAHACTPQHFPAPIALEFEKVYKPYMLFSKKRYAGLLYCGDWQKAESLDVKGLQSKRRDSCPLLQRVYKECLEMILREGDIEKAQRHVQDMVALLLARQVSMHELLLSKKLSKLEYRHKAPHVELAKKLRARDPASAPQVGDRVSYVIVEGDAKQPIAERAEHPLFAMRHDLPLDVRWYLDHQLTRPLCELFAQVMPRPESLFVGAASRVKQQFAPSSSLMRSFVRPSARCLGCNCALPAAPAAHGSSASLFSLTLFGPPRSAARSSALCAQCAPLRAALLAGKRELAARATERSRRCWDTCRACAGSETIARVCENMDCEHLYARGASDRACAELEKQVAQLEI